MPLAASRGFGDFLVLVKTLRPGAHAFPVPESCSVWAVIAIRTVMVVRPKRGGPPCGELTYVDDVILLYISCRHM